MTVTVNTDPFSIEEADGVPLVSFVSELKDADPRPERILLNARMSVLSVESP